MPVGVNEIKITFEDYAFWKRKLLFELFLLPLQTETGIAYGRDSTNNNRLKAL